MITYGLYLSTSSNIKSLQPVYNEDQSVVKWNINWREIFGSKEGETHVRIKLISNSTTDLTWEDNVGSVRASFASNYQNSSNGFNLGAVIPVVDATDSTKTYLECDTTDSKGATMIIPRTNTDFVISFYNGNETTMVNVPDYQIWLYFDC